jgi:hypothetical protein
VFDVLGWLVGGWSWRSEGDGDRGQDENDGGGEAGAADAVDEGPLGGVDQRLPASPSWAPRVLTARSGPDFPLQGFLNHFKFLNHEVLHLFRTASPYRPLHLP